MLAVQQWLGVNPQCSATELWAAWLVTRVKMA